MREEPSRIDAFISYSQEADRWLAPTLHRDLRRLNHSPFRARKLRIFLDDVDLAADPDLWSVVQGALERSRYFVIMASPAATRSRWVLREIAYWQENREASTFLIAHTAGEIVWDEAAGDFDWDRTTALPRQLAGWFPAQPGWVSLGWARGQDQLSLRHPQFRQAICKLAAPIHGLEPDVLDSEDLRQQRRLNLIKRAGTAALALLTVVAIVLSIVAVIERDRARHNETVAIDRLANLLAAESNNSTVSRRDPQRALLLALTAADMRTTEATRTALYNALESQPRLTRILTGHMANKRIISTPSGPSGIKWLIYHPRTGELISAGDDGRIIRWDPVTGRRRILMSQYVYRGSVRGLALDPDGERLVSAGVGMTALWEMKTDRPALPPHRQFGDNFAAFDSGGRLVLSGCAETCSATVITSWDPASWRQNFSVRYAGIVRAAVVSGTIMAGVGCQGPAPCARGFIQLWDTVKGQAMGDPLVQDGVDITAVDLDRAGARMVVGTVDGQVQLWDVAGRRMISSRRAHTGTVNVARFSPDGRRIATGGQDGRTVLWNAADLDAAPQTFSAYNAAVTALAFSSDGTQLATGNELNVILVWSLGTSTPTSSWFRDLEKDTEPRSVAVSPDGRTIVLGGGLGIITVYDKETQKVITRFPAAPVCPSLRIEYFKGKYQPCYLNVLKFSQDGATLFAVAPTGNISRWDTRTWNSLGDPLDADVPCRSLICDGRTPTGAGVALSPDLGLAAVGGQGQIWVWNLKTRELVHTLTGPVGHEGKVTSVAFSSDGRLLASGGEDKAVLLWNVREGRRIGAPMKHDGKVTAVAFQPGRNRLASNGADNTIRLWDTDTQQQVRSLPNDSGNYEPALTYSEDGRHLVTTTTNNYIAVWDTETLTAFPRFYETTSIMAITFHAAASELVSVAEQGGADAPTTITTRTYDVEEWKRRACRIVPRNLDLRLIQSYTLGKTQVCPDLPVDGSVVYDRLDAAKGHLDRNDRGAASDAYREATRLTTGNDDDAELANLVCLHGTVNGAAGDVLPACDHAVDLTFGSGPFGNSRAAARALTGDRAGALDDLRQFVGWTESTGLLRSDNYSGELVNRDAIDQRRSWITELENGRNPFTPDVVNSIWAEYLEDQGGNIYQTCPVDVGSRIDWVQRPISC